MEESHADDGGRRAWELSAEPGRYTSAVMNDHAWRSSATHPTEDRVPVRSRAVLLARAVLAVALVLLALGSLLPGTRVGAHAELIEASPAPDALLAAPPDRIELRFTEPVDSGAGSPAVRLVDPDNQEIAVENVAVAPDDAHVVTAEAPALGPGTYTLVWTTRSAVDGHTLSGSYAFRVAGGRAPGAATVEGEAPDAWAVATRWLTFLGIAVAAGAFFAGRFLVRDAADSGLPRRVRLLALGGVVVALLATLAEPPLIMANPPAGADAPSLDGALRSLPDAWWFRPVGLAVTLALALIWLVPSVRWRSGAAVGLAAGRAESAPAPVAAEGSVTERGLVPLVEWAGLAASLVALLGLSLTGHSAAEEGVWRIPAILANIVHQAATALWVGGLAAISLIRWGASAADLVPVRRFSTWALGFVVVATLTGVANTGIILPRVQDLWESMYGGVILLKAGALVIALALAAYHRATLRRAASAVRSVMRRTVRLETLVVAAIVLGGSVLALTSPPAVERTAWALDELTLAEPATLPDGTVTGIVLLNVDPLEPGTDNTFRISMTDTATVPQPIPADALVRLSFESLLDPSINTLDVEAAPDGAGGFVVTTSAISVESWWRVTVLLRRAGQQDATAPFYLLAPDPNLHGVDALDIPESDPDAQALYERARTQFATSTGYENHQRLASGSGGVVLIDEVVVAPTANQPGAVMMRTDQVEIRRIGDTEWLRNDPNAPWIERPASPILSPADVLQDYEGATGFQLGRQEEIDGELCQAVIFFVPGESLTPAWYVWWIGVETGTLHLEAMISRAHYMVRDYVNFNAPPAVLPPAPDEVLGAASPATPAGTGG